MTGRYCPILIAVALFVVAPSSSRGQVLDEPIRTPAGPIKIEADEVTYLREQDLYQARGNVEIRMGTFLLTSDAVDFYADTQIAEARGNVEVTDGEDVLQCESMRIDLKTQQGVVDDARLLTRENFRISGKQVEKLGPKTYRIHEGTFTTCAGDPPDWSFTAKRVDLTLEGYAVTRHSMFRVRKLPVAYLPIGVYPVKTKRQTGFLIPELGYSSKFGPEFNLPFFWAISQDKDATVYLNYLGDLGLKEGGEFRYAPSRNTTGQVNGYFLDDQVRDEDRWAFFLRHDQRALPLGFYARGDVNLVSDNDYPFDFPEDFPSRALIDARTERYLKSTFLFGRMWPEYNLVGDFSYFDNLTIEDNDRTLQRLPEITLAAFDQPLWDTPLYARGELSYANFWRREGVRGSRFDLFPEISLPFRPLGWLTFLPVAGVRETLYRVDNDTEGDNGFETRTVPNFGATLSTTASRIFKIPSLGWERVKHSIRPEVRYTYIPRVGQRDLPVFDEKDQIPYTNQVTYGLTTFVDKKGHSSGPEAHRMLRLELFQSYSLGDPFFPEEDSPEKRFSNILGKLWFVPSPYLNLRSDAEYSLIQDRIVRFTGFAKLSDSRGDSTSVEYQFSEDELEQINLYGRVRLWERADLFASYRYDLFNDIRIETEGGFTYRAQCWEVTLSVEDQNRSFDRSRDGEVKFRVSLSLTGLGSLGRGL
jgi:LPS-assembly protein